MNEHIVTAIVLGLVGGIIPGPVLTAIFAEILQSGFKKSLRIIFWAMLAETAIALFCLITLSKLGLSENIFYALSLVGAGILIWIATSLWKIKSVDTSDKVHFGVGKIVAMIVANGVLWTYWITVCIPKAMLLGEKLQHGEYLFLGIVEIAWLISTVGVAFIFSWFRKLLSNPKVIPVLFKIFALVFMYFAIRMAWGSISFFVQEKHVPVIISETPTQQQDIFKVTDGTYCYIRTQLATPEAPYSSEEHIQITIDGTTVTGTKEGTQAGPGVSNGFWGDLTGTLTDSTMELVYSYTVEGSEGKELELYEVSDSALTKLRYVLTEQGDTLVPDRTREPTRLVYHQEQCS